MGFIVFEDLPDDKYMKMENKPASIEELFQKLKDYGDTRLDLFKLKSINKASGFLSTMISSLILLILFVLAFFCITIGFALLIGSCLGEIYWGFFIIAGFYIIVGLILYYSRHKFLKTPISNKLLTELLD